MCQRRPVRALLQTGGFSVHAVLGKAGRIGFVGQCWGVAGLSALAIVAASAIDRTLLMPGRAVGLLEHPAAWGFLVLQVALPIVVSRSLGSLRCAAANLRGLLDGSPVLSASGLELTTRLQSLLQLKSTILRVPAAVFYAAGVGAFVWNSIQNQNPAVIAGFDFWDSSHHPFGFWVTRVYKLYLFGWFLPYLALVQVGVFAVVLQAVRNARLAGDLKVHPYHQDRCGGFGFVARLVRTPIIAALSLGSFVVVAVLIVHSGTAVTALMGSVILLGGAVLFYAVPMWFLRTDIVALKTAALARLSELLDMHYSQALGAAPTEVNDIGAGLKELEDISARVRAVPDIPGLPTFGGLAISIASLPPVASAGSAILRRAVAWLTA